MDSPQDIYEASNIGQFLEDASLVSLDSEDQVHVLQKDEEVVV